MTNIKEASVYLGLGANIGNPNITFDKTIQALNQEIGTVNGISRYYICRALKTQEMQDEKVPNYLNCVVRCNTFLQPLDLLEKIHDMELKLGRSRKLERKWDSRKIDIDILFYDELKLSSSELTIPHPEIQNRDFVLFPLYDIAPNLFHPVINQSIEQLIYAYHGSRKQKFILDVMESTQEEFAIGH